MALIHSGSSSSFADSAAVYSNLYLVLSLMHAGILAFYGWQFGKAGFR
ncbi:MULTISPECIES: hypothetical protein [Cohnella]|nr:MULTISPECIES: hypothetical protein [Cohnella]